MQINRRFRKFVPIIIAPLALAACVGPASEGGQRRPPASPPPRVTPSETRFQSPPAPAIAATDWRDVPLPPGDWTWATRGNGTEARYGAYGAPPIAIMTCDRATGMIQMAVADTPGAPATAPTTAPATATATAGTITTSTATATFVARPQPIGALATMVITLPASDRTWDAMAFSRGRFRIAIAGFAPVILPAWAEVGRIVEDCRG